MKHTKNKKGSELPLNTIVIALLVIIVLVVIITFFVSKMGGVNTSIDDSQDGINDCKTGSYVIGDNYDAQEVDEKTGCGTLTTETEKRTWTRKYGVSVSQGKICCITSKQ